MLLGLVSQAKRLAQSISSPHVDFYFFFLIQWGGLLLSKKKIDDALFRTSRIQLLVWLKKQGSWFFHPNNHFEPIFNLKHLRNILDIVLKPGPARWVDPGPGRPGLWPGLSKKQAGNWPGETRSTWRVGSGPGRLGQTRLRPSLIFIFSWPKRRCFGLLQLKGQNEKSRGTNAVQKT
jgi:hypothetical protein